jgi:hypothetical protein
MFKLPDSPEKEALQADIDLIQTAIYISSVRLGLNSITG